MESSIARTSDATAYWINSKQSPCLTTKILKGKTKDDPNANITKISEQLQNKTGSL